MTEAEQVIAILSTIGIGFYKSAEHRPDAPCPRCGCEYFNTAGTCTTNDHEQPFLVNEPTPAIAVTGETGVVA